MSLISVFTTRCMCLGLNKILMLAMLHGCHKVNMASHLIQVKGFYLTSATRVHCLKHKSSPPSSCSCPMWLGVRAIELQQCGWYKQGGMHHFVWPSTQQVYKDNGLKNRTGSDVLCEEKAIAMVCGFTLCVACFRPTTEIYLIAGWIAMTFGKYIHSSQRMSPNALGETFLAILPSSGSCLCFVKFSYIQSDWLCKLLGGNHKYECVEVIWIYCNLKNDCKRGYNLLVFIENRHLTFVPIDGYKLQIVLLYNCKKGLLVYFIKIIEGPLSEIPVWASEISNVY